MANVTNQLLGLIPVTLGAGIALYTLGEISKMSEEPSFMKNVKSVQEVV
jgi:hypothetical protein